MNSACVLCGISSHRVVGILPSSAPGWWREQTLHQCTVCGLVSLDPLPTLDEIAQLYTQEYYYQDGTVPLSAWIQRAYWQFQDYLAKNSTKGRFLEIGCNNGFLLAIARQRGFEVQGVEISESAPRLACEVYDLPIFIGTIEEFAAGYTGEKLDLIYASAVIEHTPDPISFLQTCRELIAQNGSMILTMPNWNAWLRKLRRGTWGGYQGYHLFYFNRQTIATVLGRCGFRIAEMWNVHDDDVINIYRALHWLKPIYRRLRAPDFRSAGTQAPSREQVDRLMREVARGPRYSKLEEFQTMLNWPLRRAMDSCMAGNAFGVRAHPI